MTRTRLWKDLPFRDKNMKNLCQTNEEIKEVKLHKSAFLVMAAIFFGNQRKQVMTLVTDNAPADPMA